MEHCTHNITSIAHWIKNPLRRTKITAQNVFFNVRKIGNCNKWKNCVIVTRVKFSVELDVLIKREK